MKVTRIDSQIVQLPAEEPLAGGPAGIGPTFDFVAVRVRTDDGVEGIGCTFYGTGLTQVVDNPGVITDIVLLGCYNATGVSAGNVTEIGGV